MKIMTTFAFLSLLVSCISVAQADTFGQLNPFEIEFVTIGNPGNAADTTGAPNPAGKVDYKYRIGKYEVSRDMITKANNAGGLRITLEDMSTRGGNGVDKPATGISWNEAARFVNWLNTSQNFSPAYKFSTQPGDSGYNSNENTLLWQSGDPGFNASNPFRNSFANYVLPTTDEWYKAAYYDPDANSGAGGYWDYATGSDDAPIPVASGTIAGTAVYAQFGRDDADITQAGGLSPFGTMAQSGNVYEWEESQFFRGGGGRALFNLSSSYRENDIGPAESWFFQGLRVVSLSSASVPEPSTFATCILLSGFGALARLRRRRR